MDESELIKWAKNAYRRDWSRKNPDKVRAAQQRYWLKRAAELVAAGKEADDASKAD